MSYARTSGVRVLVTGAGSSMGFDAIQMLRRYRGIGAIHACNPIPDFAARALADRTAVSPDFYFDNTHTPAAFADFVLAYAQAHEIDVVIPSSVFELEPLAGHRDGFAALGTLLVAEDVGVVRTYTDKLATARFLGSVGAAVPATFPIGHDVGDPPPPLPFPFLVKPRHGFGSASVSVLRNEADLQDWYHTHSRGDRPYVAQRFLTQQRDEYTCSVLYDAKGSPSHVLAMRRVTMDGMTLSACYDAECHAVEDYLRALAPRLGGRFSLNPQLRVEDGVPHIFEINPRFSASEPLRRLVGHDAYLLVLREYYPLSADVPPRRYGLAVRTPEGALFDEG